MGYFEMVLTGHQAKECLPQCCRNCLRLSSMSYELSSEAAYWCDAGIMLPTRKGTCKRQKPRHKPRK